MNASVKNSVGLLISHRHFETLVIVMIILNSITLALETYRPLYETYKTAFSIVDAGFLCFFVVEVTLRIVAQGWRFFRGGWNWFDFLIVLVSLLPMFGNLSALRALRILRALRLLSVVPEFKSVIESLVRAAKGASAVFGIIALLLFVYAVMSSKLFGHVLPDTFGNLQLSFFTHMQLLLGDNWGDIVKSTIDVSGFWTFWYFLSYTVIVAFILISMLIGVIVEAKQTVSNEELMTELKKQSRSLEASPERD